MSRQLTAQIERWFHAHDGDGEFTRSPREAPYLVVGPTDATDCIIYTTKPVLVCGVLAEADRSSQTAVIGRYGLPRESDLPWLRQLIGNRPLLFLGDLDPVDLMVFAWLRLKASPDSISYLGVSDRLLHQIGVLPSTPPTIPYAPSERESSALLRDLLPDLVDVVGNQCAQFLDKKIKVELETLICAERKGPLILSSAQQQARGG